jgi:hypothetical protein
LTLASDAFYLDIPPSSLQQGDIVAGVPLLLLPRLDHLIIVRSQHRRLKMEHLDPGDVELVRESTVKDPFDDQHEYAVVAATRGLGLLLTATCDLVKLDVWLVCPLFPVHDSGLDKGNLNAGKFHNLYALPEYSHFDSAYINFSDIRPLRPEQCPLKDRIASTTREGMNDVMTRFAKSMGRQWGYADGELAEPLGKYDTGKYRCAQCNIYDVTVSEIPAGKIKTGDRFPVCDNCAKINRAPQWYPLARHRKS